MKEGAIHRNAGCSYTGGIAHIFIAASMVMIVEDVLLWWKLPLMLQKQPLKLVGKLIQTVHYVLKKEEFEVKY